ncbi:MAG: metallopeptidase family protein [Rhodomicrobium sp.]
MRAIAVPPCKPFILIWQRLGLFWRRCEGNQESVWDPASLPDRIFLFRIPILSYARRNGEPTDRVIRHVLIHEIGHHFGFSDADMALIESRR